MAVMGATMSCLATSPTSIWTPAGKAPMSRMARMAAVMSPPKSHLLTAVACTACSQACPHLPLFFRFTISLLGLQFAYFLIMGFIGLDDALHQGMANHIRFIQEAEADSFYAPQDPLHLYEAAGFLLGQIHLGNISGDHRFGTKS